LPSLVPAFAEEKGQDQVSAEPPVELLVCTTCKREGMDPEAMRPGAVLHGALAALDLPENVVLKPVECLSNCDHGCSVVLRGGARRWTYVYGNLSEDAVDTVLDGATRYAATADGLVPWRERPEHFRKNCIARIPPQEATS
jgi:predicted metal-binding protein